MVGSFDGGIGVYLDGSYSNSEVYLGALRGVKLVFDDGS